MSPCTNCKRTSCPQICYPERDYLRSVRKQKRPKVCVYMVVSCDKFRLPLCVAESVEELARMTGVSEQSVRMQLSRVRKRRVNKSKYEMIFMDREEWEDGL